MIAPILRNLWKGLVAARPAPTAAASEALVRQSLEAAKEHIAAKRYDAAVDALSVALAQDSSNAKVWWMRGVARAGVEDPERALADFNRAAELAPREPVHPYYAALAHLRAGREAEAIASCRRALELGQNFSPAHELLASIELPGEDYLSLLERIHAHVRPRAYVEIGVFRGESIRLAAPDTRAVGVDRQPQIAFDLGPNVRIIESASDDAFAHGEVEAALEGRPVELAFIDGMHHFEFALLDAPVTPRA